MIDTEKYEGHYTDNYFARFWVTADDVLNANIERANATTNLIADAPLILEDYKRLSEENKKQHNVLTTLDEMIQRGESHIEMMKVLEQGLGLPETWKEMIE